MRCKYSLDCISHPSFLSTLHSNIQYWEVATLDVYEGFTRQKYDVMVGISAGKPIAIGECWELPSADRLAEENLWTFFMSWSELTFQWPNTNAKIHSLYNSDEAITLGDMPGWTDDDAPPNLSSAAGWAVDYSDGAMVVNLGNDRSINQIRLKITSSNTTSNDNDTNVASLYVEDNEGSSIVMKGESDESTWEFEVSHTEGVNKNTYSNHNASSVDESDATGPVPTPTPDLNQDISKAPTKSFFDSGTSLPTQNLNDYAFLSNHDTYLCSYNGGIALQAFPEQEQKTWTKISLGSDDKIALRSSDGKYLSAWWDSSMKMADHILGWEMWTEIANDDGTVSFQSYFGTYISAWPDGVARQSGEIQLWERFHEEAVNIE